MESTRQLGRRGEGEGLAGLVIRVAAASSWVGRGVRAVEGGSKAQWGGLTWEKCTRWVTASLRAAFADGRGRLTCRGGAESVV